MTLRTPVCDQLGCDVPIALAGMGGVARAELVAAVSEAGGFGFLGMVRESPRRIRQEIEAVRARTDRPFGVNLIPAATDPDLFRRELETCVAAGVRAVALFWDLAPEAIATLRGAGILVVCQVGSGVEARAAEGAGAHILIAQGVEAGGHVRGLTPRDDLVGEMVAACRCPVLAAGGVVSGADMASALALGAQGVVMGTAFLATDEAYAHGYHKERVVASDGTTVLTRAFHINWPPYAAVRVLPNSVTDGARGHPFSSPPQMIGADEDRPISLFSTDSPLRTTTGELEAMALYAGQGVGEIEDVVPAGVRLRRIAAEAAAVLAGGPGAADTSPPPPVTSSSPVCYAAQAPDTYMGYASPAELAAELNVLLEAERAGARVAAELAAQAPDAEFKALAKVIHADEVHWCRALILALTQLQQPVSPRVGDFHQKARAIADPVARLAFVNRGQGWVVRRLQALLPRVRDDGLHKTLLSMLAAHERNIETAEEALSGRQDAAAS